MSGSELLAAIGRPLPAVTGSATAVRQALLTNSMAGPAHAGIVSLSSAFAWDQRAGSGRARLPQIISYRRTPSWVRRTPPGDSLLANNESQPLQLGRLGTPPALSGRSESQANAWDLLESMAGSVKGPPDLADRHDHYLYDVRDD